MLRIAISVGVLVEELESLLELLVEAFEGSEVVLTVRGGGDVFEDERAALQSHQLSLLLRRHENVHHRLESLLRLDQVTHIKTSLTTILTLLVDLLRVRLPSQLTIAGIRTELLAGLSAVAASEPLDPLVEEDLGLGSLTVRRSVMEPEAVLDALVVGVLRVNSIELIVLSRALVLHVEGAEDDVAEAVSNDIPDQRSKEQEDEVIESTDISEED